ncbi:hypothetical protein CLOHYLEM_07083 [[Clostridium] hylemonae DSM 15053]|uniref:Uncharacterized protein n=1 Tax=[Clostridium] hylemonae DSM 15053 TaxID=553973 RepID=C0C4R7_9FIRM|nr:hypothetical protein CLOHYLEM_07083 [[Clostridium] hylemonae DSM 15053]
MKCQVSERQGWVDSCRRELCQAVSKKNAGNTDQTPDHKSGV